MMERWLLANWTRGTRLPAGWHVRRIEDAAVWTLAITLVTLKLVPLSPKKNPLVGLFFEMN